MNPELDEAAISNLPRSADGARKAGSERYFTGRPCLHGHVAARFTSSRACEQCSKERVRSWKQQQQEARAEAMEDAAQLAQGADSTHPWRTLSEEEEAVLKEFGRRRRAETQRLRVMGRNWTPVPVPINNRWAIHIADVCRATHMGYEELFDRIDKHVAYAPDSKDEFLGLRNRHNGWIPISDVWLTEAGAKMVVSRGVSLRMILEAFSNAGPLPNVEEPNEEAREDATPSTKEAELTITEADVRAIRSSLELVLSRLGSIEEALSSRRPESQASRKKNGFDRGFRDFGQLPLNDVNGEGKSPA